MLLKMLMDNILHALSNTVVPAQALAPKFELYAQELYFLHSGLKTVPSYTHYNKAIGQVQEFHFGKPSLLSLSVEC
jgi:hypothetical protein